jgi:hypothetical protein
LAADAAGRAPIRLKIDTGLAGDGYPSSISRRPHHDGSLRVPMLCASSESADQLPPKNSPRLPGGAFLSGGAGRARPCLVSRRGTNGSAARALTTRSCLDRFEPVCVALEPGGGRDQNADTGNSGVLGAILLLRIADWLAIAGAQLETVAAAIIAPKNDLRIAFHLVSPDLQMTADCPAEVCRRVEHLLFGCDPIQP